MNIQHGIQEAKSHAAIQIAVISKWFFPPWCTRCTIWLSCHARRWNVSLWRCHLARHRDLWVRCHPQNSSKKVKRWGNFERSCAGNHWGGSGTWHWTWFISLPLDNSKYSISVYQNKTTIISKENTHTLYRFEIYTTIIYYIIYTFLNSHSTIQYFFIGFWSTAGWFCTTSPASGQRICREIEPE